MTTKTNIIEFSIPEKKEKRPDYRVEPPYNWKPVSPIKGCPPISNAEYYRIMVEIYKQLMLELKKLYLSVEVKEPYIRKIKLDK